MRGLVGYYSGSGNTKLVCKAIVRSLPQVTFDLYDIARKKPLKAGQYDLYGFATFTDFVGPPQLFVSFIERLPAFPDRWACYNHCPNHAIYTAKYRGVGFYPRPLDEIRRKLDV